MRSALWLFAAAALAACSPSSEKASVSAELATLGGGTISLAACPTGKCLNVYVAPWCGYCRAATPSILKLREYLNAKGVATRIVVGMDRLAAVKDYAQTFGPATGLDPNNSVGVKGGVPHFFVTDKTGRVLKDVPGFPQAGSIERLAEFFGLP